MNQIKVALKQTILTRSTMYSNICIVNNDSLTIMTEREVITVNRSNCAIRKIHMPVLPLDIYDIKVILFLVKERIQTLSRAH